MKNRLLLALAFAGAALSSSAQIKKTTATPSAALPRPKLVVGLVVDQMRWDYLYRYYDRYQAGGFKRMLNEGFTCENTLIPYIPTVTAIGHSSIYTGSVPAIHGIAGNDFIVQATGKSMYCTDDSTVVAVGSTSRAGKMSPRNLQASTVTDELKLATNFRSKVIGIALKDRGGILPAGHVADAAYWFDDANGAWISSTYYMKQLPAWVQNFNAQKPAEKYLKLDWNTLYPINTYVQSAPDNSPNFEGKFAGTDAPTFPIKTSELYKGRAGMIRSTPYGNSMTLDLAKAAIEGENLGKNVVTDFLAVSLSSTDYVGHQFGPNSVESEDTYLRLDKDLAAFFTYLDGKLGKGNYTVFLSADHGAAHNATFMTEHNLPGGLWDGGAAQSKLNTMLADKYKVKNLVLSLDNYQVNFNNAAIVNNKISEDALKYDCIEYLKSLPEIAYAVDMQRTEVSTLPEALRVRIQNGYNPQRSGTVQIILKPGYYGGHGKTGTTHGTWNPYDAHIPLVFMGWGIKHGALARETYMTDIAPTISALLHIQAPSGNIGTAISEVIK
ncbi:alkaline phosphatase family protein [Mucilaginibacter pallidiroseus]|uniref:Alkaline phosphatase family protein n=1 Tax=Mucilaginibacter pallidiroseus TaxID=2599295 RepID=A0A563UGV8_9SPHI|nr:alkaline phosphatase PafA [Mucilaginibacter pallidiroseus]TWR30632.1 alkaline phosphatase family protein [Mucilaginibacter pallidiroseus]